MTADENPMGQVVAKALADEAFKRQLIADPAATLAAEGVAMPAGVTLKVLEDTASVRHLVLPAAGEPGRLADDELHWLSGGGDAPTEDEPFRPGHYPMGGPGGRAS